MIESVHPEHTPKAALADPARKLVSRRQCEVASVHLAETGAMLGTWILKTDFSKYFASIDRAILHREIRRKIACRDTLALMGNGIHQSMRLRFSRWSVQPAAAGVNFCGYRIWSTHKLLRKSSVQRARRKLAGFSASGDFVAKSQFLGAWLGHAWHANTHHLLTHLGILLTWESIYERLL